MLAKNLVLIFSLLIPSLAMGQGLSGTGSGLGYPNPFSAGSNFTPNVGIGSSAPGQALDVNGTVRAQAFVATNASAVNTFAGNVGIGTTIPKQPLEVVGKISTPYTGGYNIDDATTNSNVLASINESSSPMVLNGTESSGVLLEASNGSGPIVFQTGGANERMRIDSGGNTGIGYNNGSNALSVNGNIGIGTMTAYNILQVRPVSNANFSITGSAVFSTNGVAIKDIADGNGVYEPIQISASATDFANGNVGINQSAPVNALDINGTMALGTYGGVNTAPANSLIVGGNIGIGTWNPQNTLHVLGGTGSQITLQNSASPGLQFTTNPAATGQLYIGYGPTGNGFTHPTGAYIAYPSAGQLYFGLAAGTSALVTMDNNGNVGISTTTPASKLVVLNNLTVGSNNAAPTGGALINGNVGIGTDYTPDAILEVTGTASIPPFQISSTNTSNGDLFSVSTTGNIGIGTSLTGAKIQIGGNCASHTGVGACICVPAGGGAALGYCTGALGTCSACTCC